MNAPLNLLISSKDGFSGFLTDFGSKNSDVRHKEFVARQPATQQPEVVK
jgi:hypothetical protein